MLILLLKKVSIRVQVFLNILTLKIKLFNFKLNKKNKLNIDNIFRFAIKNLNKPIPFFQVKEEICNFITLVQEKKPKYVLEIGTAGGGSLFMLSQVISDEAVLISVDLPCGKFGGGYPVNRIPIYESFSMANQKIELIRLDSHSDESFDKVKQILKNRKLELIFIDGDHAYEGVKKDFELYSQLLDENGIISFHDIVPGLEENVGGVPKFWSEIKGKYKHIEFVNDWNQGGYGIGVIYI